MDLREEEGDGGGVRKDEEGRGEEGGGEWTKKKRRRRRYTPIQGKPHSHPSKRWENGRSFDEKKSHSDGETKRITRNDLFDRSHMDCRDSKFETEIADIIRINTNEKR